MSSLRDFLMYFCVHEHDARASWGVGNIKLKVIKKATFQ